MTKGLPRWVHRNPPRAAPPDSRGSLRSAPVPPTHYLDKLHFVRHWTNWVGQVSIGDKHQSGSEFNRR
jgi:hypothetical protein